MRRIALIGDYSESVVAHRAIPIALQLSIETLQVAVSWEWVPSSTLMSRAAVEPFDGVWCVPGSPYENTSGVIEAIRFARTASRPFLGTCGGFQHAMLEYAEAVWGVNALHAETNPEAANAVIAPLVCSLIGVADSLIFEKGSRLETLYGQSSAEEEYHCNYGFNAAYENRLATGDLKIAARDKHGGVRAVELDGHPFYIGTLFQPERAALKGKTPPLVQAFVQSVATL
jgi:CTP synthase (UTP-ammonia lyase)